MSGHLSAFALDEAAAGLQLQPDDTAHLASCAECAAKLTALKAENARVLASPHSSALQNKLTARHGAQPKQPRFWVVPALSALAAAVLLFIFIPRPTPTNPTPDDRLKGQTSITFLRHGVQLKRARVGDKIGLELSPAGKAYAAVFAVDGRNVTRLWPRESDVMQKLEPPGIFKIPQAFEVTPGSITVRAAFADEPLDLAELEQQAVQPRDGRVLWAEKVLEVP